jgi:hypothetical protein
VQPSPGSQPGVNVYVVMAALVRPLDQPGLDARADQAKLSAALAAGHLANTRLYCLAVGAKSKRPQMLRPISA